MADQNRTGRPSQGEAAPGPSYRGKGDAYSHRRETVCRARGGEVSRPKCRGSGHLNGVLLKR